MGTELLLSFPGHLLQMPPPLPSPKVSERPEQENAAYAQGSSRLFLGTCWGRLLRPEPSPLWLPNCPFWEVPESSSGPVHSKPAKACQDPSILIRWTSLPALDSASRARTSQKALCVEQQRKAIAGRWREPDFPPKCSWRSGVRRLPQAPRPMLGPQPRPLPLLSVAESTGWNAEQMGGVVTPSLPGELPANES